MCGIKINSVNIEQKWKVQALKHHRYNTIKFSLHLLKHWNQTMLLRNFNHQWKSMCMMLRLLFLFYFKALWNRVTYASQVRFRSNLTHFMICVKQLPATFSRPWIRVRHICPSKLTIIGSDNGLLPGRRQAIIWKNDGMLLIGPLGTNFSWILIEIQTFSFNKMRFKVSSAKWRIFCLSLNVSNNPQSQSWNS